MRKIYKFIIISLLFIAIISVSFINKRNSDKIRKIHINNSFIINTCLAVMEYTADNDAFPDSLKSDNIKKILIDHYIKDTKNTWGNSIIYKVSEDKKRADIIDYGSGLKKWWIITIKKQSTTSKTKPVFDIFIESKPEEIKKIDMQGSYGTVNTFYRADTPSEAPVVKPPQSGTYRKIR